MDTLYNRELSWLSFNRRVLQEADDKSVPLMQRLRFLGIYSNNQDEFIKVRLANLVREEKQYRGKKPKILTGGYTPDELIARIHKSVGDSQDDFQRIYKEIFDTMSALGIYMRDETALNDEQKAFCRGYFSSTISRQIVPIFLRKKFRIPFLPDNYIYLAINMTRKGRSKYFAVVPVPVNKNCPRFVRLPSPEGSTHIIFQDDIIRLCLDDIFFMFDYDSIHAYTFKIVRDASLPLDEEDMSKSLLVKMEEGLEQRLRGKPVRLVYDQDMPTGLLNFLVSKLGLTKEACESGGRYHMMRDLMNFPKLRPELENPPFTPAKHPGITPHSSILKKIDKNDLLLSFPYQSFKYVVDFLREAAMDPKVENICISLYRTAENSQIVNALMRAAQNGKQVVAVIELLARFDEERNANTVELLQSAGVRVIHGTTNLKVHSKLILVERRERGDTLKGYVYVGTGNFNEVTAGFYSDLGLLTANQDFAADCRDIFHFLGNTHVRFTCKQLVIAPYTMRSTISRLIRRETHNAQKGLPARIWIKCNNLTDRQIIRQLYKAAEAGVDVRLIVRSFCCVKASAQKESKGIKAISIVDTFLEHARVLIFGYNETGNVYISSADIMPRNLDRRLEAAAPILNSKLRQEVEQFFATQWADNVKARDLGDMIGNSYIRGGSPKIRAQHALHKYYQSMKS